MALVALSSMKIGEKGTVDALQGDDAVAQRLLELGLIPGSSIEVVRFAPMGDPINIKVRGYHLSLRRQEARTVRVAVEDPL